MSFAAEEASFVSNAEAYCLNTNSAFSFLYVEQDAFGKPIDEEGGVLPSDLPSVLFDGCYSEVFLEWAVQNFQWMEFDAGNIYNTCDTIEGRIIDLVAQLQQNKKHWAIGAFNPISVEPTKDLRHPCLEWLDKHPENSVIYVSFGTTTTVNDEQIAEIATGLEHSKQRFIWVLRDADRGNIFEGEERKAQLPNGFEERTQGVGMIVRDWAPQLEILAHSSTGGFMSHCGWNSCLESMSMGVPIAAWPMHSDQPRNAVLVSDVLKVGLLVREWARQEELISADIIQRSIRKLMSEEGNIMRKRADELGIAIRRSVSEGGSTMTQLESFLTHISRS